MVKYLDELLSFGFPLDQFALFGSAPLVVRGIRENNKDLDLIVTDHLWNVIIQQHDPTVAVAGSGDKLLKLTDEIEVFRTWPPFEQTDFLIESADIIDNVRYVKLDYVITWKSALGREKDLADIRVIKGYLRR